MVDRVFLAFERLGFVGHVLGERVERCEPLLGVLAQLVKLPQRTETFLDVLHSLHRGAAVFAGLARGLANPRIVLPQNRCGRAHLVELRLQAAGLIERRFQIRLRLPKLRAQVFERCALFLQRVEAGLGFERLRRQLLHRFTMLLKISFRSDDAFGSRLRLLDGFQQILDFLVDVLERFRAIVQTGEPLVHFVELAACAGGAFFHLLERLIGLAELAASERDLCEHFAQRAALFLRRVDQGVQLIGCGLGLLPAGIHDFEGFQHDGLLGHIAIYVNRKKGVRPHFSKFASFRAWVGGNCLTAGVQ